MELNTIKLAEGSRKNRKRVGRGIGSGHGGTSCRGHKGQKARAGGKIPAWFEGGQMPLQRRVPKRGFTNIFRQEFQIVNLQDLASKGAEGKIDAEGLVELGLIKSTRIPVKVLGSGEISKAIEISADKFSKSAVEKIEKAGGKAVVL